MFVLFFDKGFLTDIIKKYHIADWKKRIFLDVARRKDFKVQEMSSQEVAVFKSMMEGRSSQEKAKEYIEWFVTPFANLPDMDFHGGLKFENSGDVVIIFGFMTGSIAKGYVLGAFGIPKEEGKTEVLIEYFRKLAWENTSRAPMSDDTWKKSQKIRNILLKSKTPIEGTVQNFWDNVI